MNKLIALVLSISLIFGSITPSLAQSNKLMKGAQKALQQSGKEIAGAGAQLPKTLEQAAGVSVAQTAKKALSASAAVEGVSAAVTNSAAKPNASVSVNTAPKVPDFGGRLEHEILAQTKAHQTARYVEPWLQIFRELIGRNFCKNFRRPLL